MTTENDTALQIKTRGERLNEVVRQLPPEDQRIIYEEARKIIAQREVKS